MSDQATGAQFCPESHNLGASNHLINASAGRAPSRWAMMNAANSRLGSKPTILSIRDTAGLTFASETGLEQGPEQQEWLWLAACCPGGREPYSRPATCPPWLRRGSPLQGLPPSSTSQERPSLGRRGVFGRCVGIRAFQMADLAQTSANRKPIQARQRKIEEGAHPILQEPETACKLNQSNELGRRRECYLMQLSDDLNKPLSD